MNLSEAMMLYAVTDRTWTGKLTLLQQIEQALEGGVTCIQLREKELDQDSFLQEAMAVKTLCEKFHVPFIINDNVELAIKCHADGIHIGQHDIPAKKTRMMIGSDMILGVSAQTVEQALEAQADGADYLGVGAVFPTGTKKDADDVKISTLKDICQAVSIPVVAIGGISKNNIIQLKGSGIDGVAVVSAIFAQDYIKAAASELLAEARRLK